MDIDKTSDLAPQADAASPQSSQSIDIEPRPLQFSLRGMFLLMTLSAVAFSLLLAAPPMVRIAGAAFIIITLPVVLTVVLIYDRGYARTFCIGALFPAGAMLCPVGSNLPLMMVYGMGSDLSDVGYVPAIYVAATYVVSMVFGAIAMGVRRLVEARRR